MKLQIIQALLAFLFLAARISTGNVCNIKLGKEARGNGMDTRCHRTMLSLLSPPTWRIRLIAEKKPVPVTIGLTQITCPPQFVLDELYPSLGYRALKSGRKWHRRNPPSHLFSLSYSPHDYANYYVHVSLWNLVRFEIRRTKGEIFCFEAGREIGKRFRSKKW